MKNSQKIGNSFPRPLREHPDSGAPHASGAMRWIGFAIVNSAFASLLLGALLYAGVRILGDALSLSLSLWQCILLALLYLLWRVVTGALFSRQGGGSVPQ